MRSHRRRRRRAAHPTRPPNLLFQFHATATAIVREITYPQLTIPFRLWPSFLHPPPLGQSLVLLTYWGLIVGLLVSDAIVYDAYYWERIAFRAAWVSVTQVPLVFLLASKTSLIGLFIGSSYERINWFHRWVSRTLLVTVTIHGSFFVREWVLADIVQFEFELMSMVKYGIGAWAVLVWTLVSSLTPVRRMAYELFVLQHIAAACVFLWLLWVHVPAHAQFNIWFSVAVLVFDRMARGAWLVWTNVLKKVIGRKGASPGYVAEMQALRRGTTLVKVKDVGLKWLPGQHVRLSIPALGLLQAHPFTISNVASASETNDLEFVIRAHRGFSRTVYKRALTKTNLEPYISKAFVIGPYGDMPTWNTFETLVLIAASTGASFTLPILNSVLSDHCCVRRVEYLLLVKHEEHADHYIDQLRQSVDRAKGSAINVRVLVALTQEDEAAEPLEVGLHDHCIEKGQETSTVMQEIPFRTISAPITTDVILPAYERSQKDMNIEERFIGSGSMQTIDSKSPLNDESCSIGFWSGRPSLAEFVRRAVEATAGETCVAVCGGLSLTADVRNCVASLSDERAVHKGTGAQGIKLHVESFNY